MLAPVKANIKLPDFVGCKVGQVPPYNPDAEEPPEHLYARAHEVAKKRLKDRIGDEVPVNLDHVIDCKRRGTEAFKHGKFEAAQSDYEDGASLLLRSIFCVESGRFTECLEGDSPHATAMELLRACYLNSAQCCLFLADEMNDTDKEHGCWSRCVWHCSIVMASEPENTKALFRRGVADGKLRNFPRAIRDLTTAIRLEPRNKELRAALDGVYRRRDGDRKAAKGSFNFAKLAKAIEGDEPMVGHVRDPNDLSDVDPHRQAALHHEFNRRWEQEGKESASQLKKS
jgi:hypothetical protein